MLGPLLGRRGPLTSVCSDQSRVPLSICRLPLSAMSVVITVRHTRLPLDGGPPILALLPCSHIRAYTFVLTHLPHSPLCVWAVAGICRSRYFELPVCPLRLLRKFNTTGAAPHAQLSCSLELLSLGPLPSTTCCARRHWEACACVMCSSCAVCLTDVASSWAIGQLNPYESWDNTHTSLDALSPSHTLCILPQMCGAKAWE